MRHGNCVVRPHTGIMRSKRGRRARHFQPTNRIAAIIKTGADGGSGRCCLKAIAFGAADQNGSIAKQSVRRTNNMNGGGVIEPRINTIAFIFNRDGIAISRIGADG